MGRSREGRVGSGCSDVVSIAVDKNMLLAFYFWRLQILILTFSPFSTSLRWLQGTNAMAVRRPVS
jgi:hypothetical protein